MTLSGVLLGLLDSGPAHGYDLKRRHNDHLAGSHHLALPQVYATLARLRRDGLVEANGVEQQGGPKRQVYARTAAGAEHLRHWLRTPESSTPYLQ